MSLNCISAIVLFSILFISKNVYSFVLTNGLSESAMFGNEISSIESEDSVALNIIGQVGGVAFDPNGDLAVFHRADRTWSWNSFNGNNFNTQIYPNPIQGNVITHITPDTYDEVHSWGKNLFYLPHGLTVDHEGNFWLTDVALHQVFKFTPNNLHKPALTLGVAFEPGNDNYHFCKPTSVAISEKNGDIFVADGYCNSRVVQFDKSGKYIKQFIDGQFPLQIAHSVTLIESQNLVVVASRQDGRIVCFDMTDGTKKSTIRNELMKTVYAIRYDKANQVLHAVTGENNKYSKDHESFGLTFETNSGGLLSSWQPIKHTMDEAHDLAVSPDGSQIFVGQLNGELDKFVINE
jgi:peptidylamidoglycolate lyase